ncbi:MAG: hypothetical protein FJ147_14255 [Deltaproteobacteria bacterium]|nr:hypothetical protein [Deltaproteobacteria bacterium]
MAQRKRSTPVPRKQRSWTLAKFLLIVGYGAVFAFLGVIYMMRQELFRVGIFGEKQAIRTPVPQPTPPPQVLAEPQRSASPLPPPVVQERLRSNPPSSVTTRSPSAPTGEITADEKQALDDILRSKR